MLLEMIGQVRVNSSLTTVVLATTVSIHMVAILMITSIITISAALYHNCNHDGGLLSQPSGVGSLAQKLYK